MKRLVLLLSFAILFAFASNAQKEQDTTIQHISGYKLLELNLSSISRNNLFTTFVGLDVNFADMRFSMYLQDDMKLTPTKNSNTPTLITETYIPHVSTGKQHLTVSYKVKKTDNKPYIDTDDGKCITITECNITGSTDLIIKLFLSYWPQRINFGGYKKGTIAYFDIMGDRISLIGLDRPNTYKINIAKGDISFNYYNTFKIK